MRDLFVNGEALAKRIDTCDQFLAFLFVGKCRHDNQASDFLHFFGTKAACCHSRRSNANTGSFRSTAAIAGNFVLIDGNMYAVETLFQLAAADLGRTESSRIRHDCTR